MIKGKKRDNDFTCLSLNSIYGTAGLGMKKKLARDKSRVQDQSYDNCARGAQAVVNNMFVSGNRFYKNRSAGFLFYFNEIVNFFHHYTHFKM